MSGIWILVVVTLGGGVSLAAVAAWLLGREALVVAADAEAMGVLRAEVQALVGEVRALQRRVAASASGRDDG